MIPIVLVPGLLCTAEVFAPQIAALWTFGPVTVASTMGGKTVRDITAAILESAPPHFALAGFSMGGFVSFEIMRRAPERVKKLALLDTVANPFPADGIEGRREMVEQARTGDFTSLLSKMYSEMVHPSCKDDPKIREIGVRMGLTVGVDAFDRQTEALISRADSRDTLAEITVPTLVLVGDSDPLVSLDRSKEMAAGISGSKLVIVPECGHFSTLEQPGAVNRALIEWIAN